MRGYIYKFTGLLPECGVYSRRGASLECSPAFVSKIKDDIDARLVMPLLERRKKQKQ